MNEEELKNAVREYIDSIKNEPWYDVTLDDIILESWIHAIEWLRKKDTAPNGKKVNLYECASLFAESMNDKFPNGCADGSAVLLITTDGKRLSSLVDGDDNLITKMVANFVVNDKDTRNLVANGVVAAIQHNLQHKAEVSDEYNEDDSYYDDDDETDI